MAPATVGLMVGDLSRRGVLTRKENDADRAAQDRGDRTGPHGRDRSVAFRQCHRLDEVLAPLTPPERATIVATMRAYEAALDEQAST